MKIVKKFENFILEFKETEKNTPILFKDDNLEVKVVKTFDSCAEQGKDTDWCSNKKDGYYFHNKTANMYRFNFNDGYKLRLTWDYVYDRGTNWGQGGVVNGESQSYLFIRPTDPTEPFLFDYNKENDTKLMVNRIESLPQEVIDIVHDYQSKHSLEKSAALNKAYNEISKISIIDIQEFDKDIYGSYFKVIIKYLGKEYETMLYYEEEDSYYTFTLGEDFSKDFKNKLAVNTTIEIDNYLKDKVNEFIKKNNININD